MDINEIRIINLKHIILEKHGNSVHRFATDIGRDSSQFYSIFKGRRKFGQNLARDLETELKIPENTLDRSPDEETIINKIALIPLYVTNPSSKPNFTDKAGDIFAIEKSLIENHNWNKDMLFGLIIDDEAMSPTIQNNSKIIIDTSQTTIENGKVYALSKNNEIFTRRVFKQIGSTVYEAKPDNEKFSKIDFRSEGGIKILGRIVYLLGQEL